MNGKSLFVGNSDGIGLGVTQRLLKNGYEIIGISRSESPVKSENYKHYIADVSSKNYTELLSSLVEKEQFEICIYFAGIGELLDPLHMNNEVRIFEVNIMGLVNTVTLLIPQMVKSGRGHLVGLSSVADELFSADAPSYHASKAGFSNYMNSLSLALKPSGVYVTNVRFGFVDTKMAKGDVRPFMISVDNAVGHILKCLDKKPVNYTAPKIIIPFIKFRKMMLKMRLA